MKSTCVRRVCSTTLSTWSATAPASKLWLDPYNPIHSVIATRSPIRHLVCGQSCRTDLHLSIPTPSKDFSQAIGTIHAHRRHVMPEQLLTVEQVANYLNVDKFTVYRLVADKNLSRSKSVVNGDSALR